MDKYLEDFEELKSQYKIENQIIPDEKFEFLESLYHGRESKKLIEELTCLICLKIVDNPVRCGKCYKLFCESCIENVIANYINCCPNCRCFPFNKLENDLFLKNLLDKSEFICPLGCGKIIKKCEQVMHKKECTFIEKFYQCSICKTDVGKDVRDLHKSKCPILKTKCLGCDEPLNKLDYKDHFNYCQNRIIYCDNLKIYYSRKYDCSYKVEFKDLLSIFHSFYQRIKKLSKHFFNNMFTFLYLISMINFQKIFIKRNLNDLIIKTKINFLRKN